MAVISALHRGVCPECDQTWQPGDPIRIVTPGTWGHAVCPDPLPTASTGETSCPVCWLIHPEGECDR